jgi:hypothetical protein
MKLRLPRPLWITLATVVLVVVGVGVRLGLPAYRQREAIRAIREHGGEIEFRRSCPEWVQRCLGNDGTEAFDVIEGLRFVPDEDTFFRRFDTVYVGNSGPWFDGPTVDDTLLAIISHLPSLTGLDLSYTNVGDGGIAHVAALTELQRLSLYGTDVSDASIPLFLGLKNLTWLELSGTRVTSDGIARLRAEMPGCKVHRRNPRLDTMAFPDDGSKPFPVEVKP